MARWMPNRVAEASRVAGLLTVQLRDDRIFLAPLNAAPWYLERQDQPPILIENENEKRFYAHYQMALTHFLSEQGHSDASAHVGQARALKLPNSRFIVGLIGLRIRRLGEKQPELVNRLEEFQREFF